MFAALDHFFDEHEIIRPDRDAWEAFLQIRSIVYAKCRGRSRTRSRFDDERKSEYRGGFPYFFDRLRRLMPSTRNPRFAEQRLHAVFVSEIQRRFRPHSFDTKFLTGLRQGNLNLFIRSKQTVNR